VISSDTSTSPDSEHTSNPEVAIEVVGLRKSYGDRDVVKGVDFDVGVGECFGLLGPNGAGKTTIIEICEGYTPRDSGSVRVLGADPAEPTAHWRARVGIVPQDMEVLPTLTVVETLRMFADLYPHPRTVPDSLGLVGLEHRRSSRVGKLSGGEKRRLDVALGLIGDPSVLFLDEPTTGLDPSARREVWTMIEGLKASDVTIVLTTHYMEEAEVLADRLMILSDGTVAAEGTFFELLRQRGGHATISFSLPDGVTIDEIPESIQNTVVDTHPRVCLTSERPQNDLQVLLQWAAKESVSLEDLSVTRDSLDDIFLSLGQRDLTEGAQEMR
jgi:ABC-2 type transport system ATP-binding protein